jgi:hypothetical protein
MTIEPMSFPTFDRTCEVACGPFAFDGHCVGRVKCAVGSPLGDGSYPIVAGSFAI